MTKTVSRRFDSVSAMLNFAATATYKNSGDIKRIMKSRREQTLDNSWYGMPYDCQQSPIAYAANLISTGWPEGVKKLQEAIKGVADIAPPESLRRKLVWADHGDEISMQRVWSGQIDQAWRRAARCHTRAPLPVTIWIPFTISSSCSHEMLFWQGAAVAALADAMGSAGYAVAIKAYNHSPACVNSGDRPLFDIVTTIKDHGRPMDIATLAAAVAAPATIRGASYACEAIAAVQDGFPIGVGIATPDRSMYRHAEPQDLGDGLAKAIDAASAAAWVVANVERIQARNHIDD